MSARGDSARRRHWAERDKQWDKRQFDAALESWFAVLPKPLLTRLEQGVKAIFGKRFGAESLNSTREEQDRVVALITEINLAWAAGHDPSDSQPGHEENTMSLEQAIKDLTAAVEANTAAQKAGGGAASTKAPKETKETKAAKPAHTREELAAIMGKVKAEKTADVAKALIKSDGKSDKLAEVAEENIDALYAAAEAKLKEEDEM